MVLETAQY